MEQKVGKLCVNYQRHQNVIKVMWENEKEEVAKYRIAWNDNADYFRKQSIIQEVIHELKAISINQGDKSKSKF